MSQLIHEIIQVISLVDEIPNSDQNINEESLTVSNGVNGEISLVKINSFFE
jgi:hypothetical protein